ncbi:legumain precursor [Silurus meridionalis]|nr:legumain precursor [Silurus meridionalis]
MASNRKQWFLLAAGSKDWENYRHQADVCHAYQVLHQNGIPDEQIVVMMYDDIAYNHENPFPGNIINVPEGPNVYSGVPKDYTGELYARDLIDTVKEMSRKGQFSEMVIYMEACHAGSMLDELPSLSKVYAVAACTPDESSYACFKDKRRNAFLADVFTAYWLHHTKSPQLDPVHCPVGSVLEFQQEQFAKGLAPPTLKVYVFAILVYHAPVAGQSLGRDPLLTRFLCGTQRLRLVVQPRVPGCDLAVVLEALSEPPFEPLTEASWRHLTVKTAFLPAICFLRRVGDLQALSFLEFTSGIASAFFSLEWAPDQEKLNWPCPVGALDTYVLGGSQNNYLSTTALQGEASLLISRPSAGGLLTLLHLPISPLAAPLCSGSKRT